MVGGIEMRLLDGRRGDGGEQIRVEEGAKGEEMMVDVDERNGEVQR